MRSRRLGFAIGGALAALALAACGPEARVAASAVDDVARAVGVASHEVSLADTQLVALARQANVEQAAVRTVAEGAAQNATWRRIRQSIAEMDAATSGPERGAVVATACDYFEKGQVSVADLAKNLVEAHASGNPQVRAQQLRKDTNELIRTLQKEDPTVVAVLCYTIKQIA